MDYKNFILHATQPTLALAVCHHLAQERGQSPAAAWGSITQILGGFQPVDYQEEKPAPPAIEDILHRVICSTPVKSLKQLGESRATAILDALQHQEHSHQNVQRALKKATARLPTGSGESETLGAWGLVMVAVDHYWATIAVDLQGLGHVSLPPNSHFPVCYVTMDPATGRVDEVGLTPGEALTYSTGRPSQMQVAMAPGWMYSALRALGESAYVLMKGGWITTIKRIAD